MVDCGRCGRAWTCIWQELIFLCSFYVWSYLQFLKIDESGKHFFHLFNVFLLK